jgi:TPR repeat protein
MLMSAGPAFPSDLTPDLPALMRCQAQAEAADSRSRMYAAWLHRAAEDDPLAAFCLSFTPSDKPGVPLAWLKHAADLQLPDAQLLLGANYEVGLSLPRDFGQALYWYTQAAQQDFPFAQMELASVFFEGRAGVLKNPREALFWILLASRHHVLAAEALQPRIEAVVSEADRTTIRHRVSRWRPQRTSVMG